MDFENETLTFSSKKKKNNIFCLQYTVQINQGLFWW